MMGRTHASLRANIKQQLYWESTCDDGVRAERERRYYQIIETGMIENRLSRLLLRERLGGLLSMACEHKALCASALKMHLHDHHVCMFVHTALLFWPILSVHRAHLLCPPGNDMDYIRKMIVWNIFFVVYSITRQELHWNACACTCMVPIDTYLMLWLLSVKWLCAV